MKNIVEHENKSENIMPKNTEKEKKYQEKTGKEDKSK